MKIFTQNDLYHPPTKLETSFRARLKVNSATAERYIPQIWSDKFSVTIKKRHFNHKTLGEKVLEEMKKLQKQGLSNEKIKELFTKIKEEVPNYKCFNDILDNLTKALPKKTDPLFAYKRMQVSFDNSRFNKDTFNLFNTAYKKYSSKKDFDIETFSECVYNCSDYQNNRMIEQRKKYLLNNSSKASLADTKDLFQNIHPVALRYIETLQKKGRKIDYKIFKDYFIDSDPTCFGAFFELCKKYPKLDTVYLASIAKDCVDKEGVFSQNVFNVVYSCLDSEYFEELFKHCRTEDGSLFNQNKILFYYNLRKNGWKEEEIDTKIFKDENCESISKKTEIFTAWVIDAAQMNPDIDKDIVLIMCHFSSFYNDNLSLQTLINITRKGFENLLSIGRNYENIDKRAIMELFAFDPDRVLRTYGILGEKVFTNILKTKDYKEIGELMSFLGSYGQEKVFEPTEALLKAINPKNSNEYKDNDIFIRYRKASLDGAVDSVKKKYIKQINDHAYRNNQLLKNSIKDPQEALEMAIIYKTLWDKDPELAMAMHPFMKNNTADEKKEFYKFLNNHLLKIIGINSEYSPSLYKKFDLSKSKYLPHIMQSKPEFRINLETLLHNIDKYPNLTVEDALNMLPFNEETNYILTSRGLDCNKWSHFNPDMKVKFKTKIDLDLAKQSVLKNFEKDLNDELIYRLPVGERHRIYEVIKDAGYTLDVKEEPIYDEEGYLEDVKRYVRVLNGSNSLVVDDLKNILNKIKDEMTVNPFWTEQHNSVDIDDAKELFKEHILVQRHNELKKALNKYKETVRMRKVGQQNEKFLNCIKLSRKSFNSP